VIVYDCRLSTIKAEQRLTVKLRWILNARKDRENISKDINRVFAIFHRLEERKAKKAGTLSGGEQQMLAIRRAFMSGRKHAPG
jgi:ABC-type branched-subunit amino acid transport system ATPase component